MSTRPTPELLHKQMHSLPSHLRHPNRLGCRLLHRIPSDHLRLRLHQKVYTVTGCLLGSHAGDATVLACLLLLFALHESCPDRRRTDGGRLEDARLWRERGGLMGGGIEEEEKEARRVKSRLAGPTRESARKMRKWKVSGLFKGQNLKKDGRVARRPTTLSHGGKLVRMAPLSSLEPLHRLSGRCALSGRLCDLCFHLPCQALSLKDFPSLYRSYGLCDFIAFNLRLTVSSHPHLPCIKYQRRGDGLRCDAPNQRRAQKAT
nr:hypothetical protein CFP56_54997 [Quercus suber]